MAGTGLGPPATNGTSRLRGSTGRGSAIAAVAIFAALACVYLFVGTRNPPGFGPDEAAIAYNAARVERAGRDEYGARFPLYFESFGDYKSPVYVYLLAGVFRIVSPGIVQARLLSALLGLAAVLVIGVLATLVSGRLSVGIAGAFLAGVNPWLFELSRLVYEVAFLPLATALFLLALYRAQARGMWARRDYWLIGASLALIAYAYPTGRLLSILLAAGLLVFASSAGIRGILLAWLVYGLMCVPILVFGLRHPGALTQRFWETTYLKGDTSLAEALVIFPKAIARNIDLWSWIVRGNPNPRHHVAWLGSLLVATAIVAVGGFVLVLLRHRNDAWWRYCVYGLAASLIPASLTVDRLHSHRLSPFYVFLMIICVPAIDYLLRSPPRWRRVVTFVLAVGLITQAILFQLEYRKRGPERGDSFEAAYPGAFAIAAATQRRPIYVYHTLGNWYGVLGGLEADQVLKLDPVNAVPHDALLVSDRPCDGCRLIGSSGGYSVYITPEP